jgi:hypothetical protein
LVSSQKQQDPLNLGRERVFRTRACVDSEAHRRSSRPFFNV